MSILHITYDLRSADGSEKTKAVANLIDITGKLTEAKTIDIVRVGSKKNEISKFINSRHLLINSHGFPKGLFLLNHLDKTFNKIIEAGKHSAILKDVEFIHAHKLTFEGVIAQRLAQHLNVPYLITLRQTDLFVIKYRPDLKRKYLEILRNSTSIFYLIPVMKKYLREIAGEDFYNKFIENRLVFLPNIIERNITSAPVNSCKDILTILRMEKESVKRKNFKKLLIAFSRIDSRGHYLNVAGEGSYKPEILKWIKKYNLENKVRFLGKIPNSEIDGLYSSSIGFVLPSFSESFGMVYAESLINSTPIMYSKNVLGFDGFFDEAGIGVDPYSVDSIMEGLNELINNHRLYKQKVIELKEKDAFSIFSSKNVYNVYKNVYESITRKNADVIKYL